MAVDTFEIYIGWNDRCIKVSDFPNLMTNRMRMALTIYYTASIPHNLLDLVRKGLETEGFLQMVRAFREFRSERTKRTTSGGCLQFPKRFSGKLPFHLTSNRNFRIFWLSGKHPICQVSFSFPSRKSLILRLATR